jgi:hypothetical protein
VRRAWIGLGLLVATSVAATDETGSIYARQGTVQIEAAEAVRWRMRVETIRKARDEVEIQLADLRGLLETAMAELERVTKDRDAWRARAEATPRGGRNP